MAENNEKVIISENPVNENENSNIIENINESGLVQESTPSSQVEEIKSDEMKTIEDPEPTNEEKAAKSDEMELKTDAIENSTQHETPLEPMDVEPAQEVVDINKCFEDIVQNDDKPAQSEESSNDKQKSDELQPEKTVDDTQNEDLVPIQATKEPDLEVNTLNKEDDITSVQQQQSNTAQNDFDAPKVEDTITITEESQPDKIDAPSTSEGINHYFQITN
jgi:hypothetical protein